jgi:quinolinate synthase
VHDRILPRHVERRRAEFPGAPLVVHPECRPEVVALADAALSTSGIVRFAAETDATHVLIGTEMGILHRLQKENPEKTFVPVTEQAICPDMKKTTLESVLAALETMEPRVTVPESIRSRALTAVRRMTDG